jgi:asparagine N-glycosylation enzyme membrane subunit Stt3
MRSNDQPAVATGPHISILLLLIWLLWSAVMVAFSVRQGGTPMVDPDDFMRMAEVRDWMAGQSWFDVTQYRINPPDGGSMHWSRLLDIPVAAMIALFRLFLPQPMAEHLTTIFLPLLLLGLLMLIMFRAVTLLAGNRIALLAAFLVPSYPLIVRQFMPGRVDHHNWQIVMAAVAMLALFDRNPRRGALIMAFALSLWMHISIEGLPYAVMFGVILALSYLFPMAISGKAEDVRLLPYTGGLAVFSAALFVATQSSSKWIIAYCDAVSWPLLAALAVVGTSLAIGHHGIKPQKTSIKILILSVAGLCGGALFIFASDSCALDPFGNLSPLVREYWHETISEGLPIYKQHAAIVSLLLFVPMLAALGIVIVWRNEQDEMRKKQWLTLAMLIGAATILSFKVQRTAGVAELFSLPAIAALTALFVRRTMESAYIFTRIFGTVSIVFALSPITAFVAGEALFSETAEAKPKTHGNNDRQCDLAELNRLPPGLIFTTMAAGPEILYRTHHSVYASGYHRNSKIMGQLIATMVGPADQARALFDSAKIDYVMFCPSHFEAMSYIKAGKQNFASSLMSSTPPIWLDPVKEFEGSHMRVYRYSPEPAKR